MSIRHRAAALAVAGIILLAGCSSEDPAEFDDSGSPTGESEESSAPEDEPESGDDETEVVNTGEAIGASWPDPNNVVAEDVFPVPGSERDKIRIGIEAIVVTDETMELRLMLTPEEGGDGIRVWDVLREQIAIEVRLIDRVNLKEYSVLKADGKRYMPNDSARLTAGHTLGYPIFYAPPEDDIDKVDVRLNSSLPIFEDVPLTYEK